MPDQEQAPAPGIAPEDWAALRKIFGDKALAAALDDRHPPTRVLTEMPDELRRVAGI